MSDDASRSTNANPSPRRSSRRRRFKHGIDPFFLSPTWTWPEFDPACCQECGCTIPMHEIGWILEEKIHCGDCFQILDQQRMHRENVMQTPAALVATASPPSEPIESDFTLTEPPPYHPPCFAAALMDENPAAEPAPTVSGELPLFDEIDPAFTLTPPLPFHPLPCFAAALLHETPAPPEATMASDGLPLFDEIDPAFELTEPPPFVPRAHFADIVVHESPLHFSSSEDGSLPLFERAPEVEASAMRDVNVEPVQEVIVIAPLPMTAELPVLDLASPSAEEIEELTPTQADQSPVVSQELPAMTTKPPVETRPLISAAEPVIAPPAAESTAAIEAVTIAPQVPIVQPSAPPPIAEIKPTVEQAPPPPPMVALPKKARPRKPRLTLPAPSNPPPPLVFQHPVDALLDELHRQQIDANVYRTMHKSRATDPFFAEVDAMLAAADELRDIWMARRESAKNQRSQSG